MLNNLPVIMLRCLLQTVLIETGFAFITGIRNKHDLLNVILVNLMTNPAVVVSTFLVGFFFGPDVRMPVEICEEIAVVLIEGLVYLKTLHYRRINPFLVALILNGISYAIGYGINLIIY